MILKESSRDNLLAPYVELLKERGIDTNVSQLKQFLLAKFVNEAYIRNLSLESNYYLAGVAKYYFQGLLTNNKELNVFNRNQTDDFNREICQKLNALILVLRNSYIDSVGEKFEQPEDFGTLSLPKLLRKYNKAISNEIVNDVEQLEPDKLNRDNHVGNGYTFDILYNYDDARKYNKYTEPGAWCITYGQSHYNYYKNNLKIHYVIFLKDGFENVPRKKTEGWTEEKPHDEYGNSMIAFLQSDSSYKSVYITSRWNHGSYEDNSRCEADHAYTLEEFMKITGIGESDLKRIYSIWKQDCPEKTKIEIEPEKKEVLRKFKYAQMKLNGGNFDNLFDGEEVVIERQLSNNELINRLKENYQQTQDASSLKQLLKAVKNSITLKSVILFGKKYYFLMDGKKILFETIMPTTENHVNLHLFFTSGDFDKNNSGYWDDFGFGKKNLIIIRKPKESSWNVNESSWIMLYDARKHTFIEIEGVKKFKKIATFGKNSNYTMGGFYEVAVSKYQKALLNIETNEPLVLPNGRCWVEGVSSSKVRFSKHETSIKANCFFASDGLIKIIVDSSSGENYFYDIPTKKFIDIRKFAKNNEVISIENDWLSNYLYGYTVVVIGGDYRRELLFYHGSPVSIEGSMYFSTVEFCGCNLIEVSKYVEETDSYDDLLFDISKMKRVEFPFNGDFSPHTSKTKRVVRFSVGRGYKYNVFYDSKFGCWLKNPLSDEYSDLKTKYIFKVYSNTYENDDIMIYKQDSDYTIEIVLAENEPLFVIKDEIKLDDLSESNYGYIYSVDNNDFVEILNEIIKKIKV